MKMTFESQPESVCAVNHMVEEPDAGLRANCNVNTNMLREVAHLVDCVGDEPCTRGRSPSW